MSRPNRCMLTRFLMLRSGFEKNEAQFVGVGCCRMATATFNKPYKQQQSRCLEATNNQQPTRK